MSRDLAEEIRELRVAVESRLRANKYYVAIRKIDEFLAAIKPLGTIDDKAKFEPPSVEPVPEAIPADGDNKRTIDTNDLADTVGEPPKDDLPTFARPRNRSSQTGRGPIPWQERTLNKSDAATKASTDRAI